MTRAKGVFLAGTDTDIGKTYVGCLMAQCLVRQGRIVGAYKPVASGFADVVGSDGERLWQATSCHGSLETVSPQRFREPFAPPVAAALEGRVVSHDQILDGYQRASSQCDLILVEGAGGLLSPISDDWTNADLIVRLRLPVVLVSAWRLGVVNQVLTAMIAADALGISLAAIVLNACQSEPVDGSHLKLLKQFLAHQERPHHWSSVPVVELRYGTDEFEPVVEQLSSIAQKHL
jgi:dethiobiotin synthetase